MSEGMMDHKAILNDVGDILEAIDPAIHFKLAENMGDDLEHISVLMQRELRRIAEQRGECFGCHEGRLDFWPKLQFLTLRLLDEGFTLREIQTISQKSFIEVRPRMRHTLYAGRWGTASVALSGVDDGRVLSRDERKKMLALGGDARDIRDSESPGFWATISVGSYYFTARISRGDPYVMSARIWQIGAMAINKAWGKK